MMSAVTVEVSGETRFEAVYVDAGGIEARVGWERLASVAVEWGRPVRRFPSYRGQGHYPGLYWSATMGRHVGYESWVERDHLVALDFDRAVVAIASQPFWLLWGGEQEQRRHAPDFFARLADGSAVVVDSRPGNRRGRERDATAFTATEQACWLVGWHYMLWDVLDPLVAGNLRWLAGYRHPRCHDEVTAARLREVFDRPWPLMTGAELAGDPIAVLPVLFHLLWRGELLVDLTLVLSDRSVVRPAFGGERG